MAIRHGALSPARTVILSWPLPSLDTIQCWVVVAFMPVSTVTASLIVLWERVRVLRNRPWGFDPPEARGAYDTVMVADCRLRVLPTDAVITEVPASTPVRRNVLPSTAVAVMFVAVADETTRGGMPR